MADADRIKTALQSLDPDNNDQWTSSGQPLVDAVQKAMGDATVTRQEITNADPQFSRDALKAALSGNQSVTDPVEKTGDGKPDVQEQLAQRAGQLDELEGYVAEAEKDLRDTRERAEKAQHALVQAQLKRDALLAAADKLKLPLHVENTHSIQAFIAKQAEERAARAGVAQELRKHGITPQLLAPGSKLDQAMARKRGFGLTRPTAYARG